MARQTPFIKWVSELAYKVGLSEWEIEVVADADIPDDVLARCSVPRARQAAKIMLGPQFFEETPEGKRATIVHELLHCHFAQVMEVTDGSLPQLLGRPAYHVFEAAHELALERCLDAVAVAFASVLPLPPEGE